MVVLDAYIGKIRPPAAAPYSHSAIGPIVPDGDIGGVETGARYINNGSECMVDPRDGDIVESEGAAAPNVKGPGAGGRGDSVAVAVDGEGARCNTQRIVAGAAKGAVGGHVPSCLGR